MSGLSSLLLSIAMLAVCGLAMGAVAIWRRGDRKKGALMATAALVLLGNVLIVTV